MAKARDEEGWFPAETAASFEAQNEQRARYEGRSVGLKASATKDGTRYIWENRPAGSPRCWGVEAAGQLFDLAQIDWQFIHKRCEFRLTTPILWEKVGESG